MVAEAYDAAKDKGVQVEKFGAEVTIGEKKFDIKRVLMQLLPTLMSLVTELLVTGKIAKAKGRDLALIKAVLYAIIGEIDNLETPSV